MVLYDEGAPHSVTFIQPWMSYLHTKTVTPHLLTISNHVGSISFGVKGHGKLQHQPIGLVLIIVPLSNGTYFNYRSLLISNDVPMLIGFQTQTRLRALTDKDLNNLSITLRANNINLPLWKVSMQR